MALSDLKEGFEFSMAESESIDLDDSIEDGDEELIERNKGEKSSLVTQSNEPQKSKIKPFIFGMIAFAMAILVSVFLVTYFMVIRPRGDHTVVRIG